MSEFLKHVVVLGLALPLGIGGYHLAATALAQRGERAPGSAEAADLSFGRSEYRLSALPVLERDLYWLESRYVERERLDPDAMFQAALDRVERDVPEVMFQREPEGRRLHIAVGDFSTVMLIEPLDGFAALASQLRRVAVVLDQNLSEEVNRPEVEYSLISGALSTLDPHTILMPPEQANEMDVDNKGEFFGLGIEIHIRDGWLTIKEPMADGPADRVGLHAGDQIVRIDDESTINMDLNDAVRKLRGRKGEPVTIMVMRKGFSEARPFTVQRDAIKTNPVEGELLEGNIGYVRIENFHLEVGVELETILARFKREAGAPLRGLVLDLRGNPGGYLTEAVAVSDKFIKDGVIVSTVDGGSGRREEQRASKNGTVPDYPIAVLVNANSASASEIVAGALRNQDRAVIIGERSFGKGSVQNLYNHDDGSRLKLTVAKYLTPGDKSIQAVGIPPDIELLPALVEASADAGEDPSDLVSLYRREWLEREADLDNVLHQVSDEDLRPPWSLRYLQVREDVEADDPRRDWEVLFSREVLLAATGPRRPEVLAAAGPVVERRAAQEEQRIRQAFSARGIDWTDGPLPEAPERVVSLDLGPDDMLVAGQDEDLRLVVENHSDQPVYQLSAFTESENPYLDHREFYLGRLDPGQSKSASVKLSLHDGYPGEMSPLTIRLRTPDAPALQSEEHLVEIQGRPLPRFEYVLSFFDDGSGTSRGDGDGLPEVGETIDVEVTLTNAGEGQTVDPFTRIKNKSGAALDLRQGSLDLGERRRPEGGPCPEAEEDCVRVMELGGSQTGRLSFELRSLPEGGTWQFDLLVGDNRAYDFASVQRGGFYEYFQLKETLVLDPGKPFANGPRQPPRIEVTRAPEPQTGSNALVVSGKVNDDQGLRDLMIFQGEDKVFFRGGGHGETQIPFAVEGLLVDGPNHLVVLARDERGLTATRAITTWYRDPEAQARAMPEPTPAAP